MQPTSTGQALVLDTIYPVNCAAFCDIRCRVVTTWHHWSDCLFWLSPWTFK